MSKARKFGIESFAESLVPVRDSLEAALAQPEQTVDTLREGVEVTLKQLAAAFERNLLKEIAPAQGDKFDPHLHQAISSVPADQPANTVLQLLQKGYAITARCVGGGVRRPGLKPDDPRHERAPIRPVQLFRGIRHAPCRFRRFRRGRGPGAGRRSALRVPVGQDCYNCNIFKQTALLHRDALLELDLSWFEADVYADEPLGRRFSLHGVPTFVLYRAGAAAGTHHRLAGPAPVHGGDPPAA